MEKLEQAVQQIEADFIEDVKNILSGNCADRIKIAKLYQVYISTVVKINTTTSEAKV